jgi:hypothetical protein
VEQDLEEATEREQDSVQSCLLQNSRIPKIGVPAV